MHTDGSLYIYTHTNTHIHTLMQSMCLRHATKVSDAIRVLDVSLTSDVNVCNFDLNKQTHTCLKL